MWIWILAAIAAVIWILLMMPLVLSIRYADGKLKFEVTYMFIKIFPFKEKKAKSGEDKPSSVESPVSGLPETEASADADTPQGKSKRSLAEMIELGKSIKEKLGIIYGSSSKGIKRILRKIVVDNIYADITIRSEDAAKTAVNYGIVSGIVYGIIAAISSLATTYVESCDIDCDFENPKKLESDVNVSLKFKMRLHILLSSGLLIGTKLLRKRRELTGSVKKSAAIAAE
ncbi:MAG: DUF2953 domain-containing protein [Ruminococcus sp.]|jgi:hypothetical protein|nr:DUF2953 domain-containing protein [Ruminococcus sp.]